VNTASDYMQSGFLIKIGEIVETFTLMAEKNIEKLGSLVESLDEQGRKVLYRENDAAEVDYTFAKVMCDLLDLEKCAQTLRSQVAITYKVQNEVTT